MFFLCLNSGWESFGIRWACVIKVSPLSDFSKNVKYCNIIVTRMKVMMTCMEVMMTRVKVMMTCREVMITLFGKTRYLHQHTVHLLPVHTLFFQLTTQTNVMMTRMGVMMTRTKVMMTSREVMMTLFGTGKTLCCHRILLFRLKLNRS